MAENRRLVLEIAERLNLDDGATTTATTKKTTTTVHVNIDKRNESALK